MESREVMWKVTEDHSVIFTLPRACTGLTINGYEYKVTDEGIVEPDEDRNIVQPPETIFVSTDPSKATIPST